MKVNQRCVLMPGGGVIVCTLATDAAPAQHVLLPVSSPSPSHLWPTILEMSGRSETHSMQPVPPRKVSSNLMSGCTRSVQSEISSSAATEAKSAVAQASTIEQRTSLCPLARHAKGLAPLRFALAVRQPRDVSRSVLSRLGSRAQLSEIHIPKVAARYATTFWFREKKGFTLVKLAPLLHSQHTNTQTVTPSTRFSVPSISIL